jgi:hypothetical protein
MDGEEGVARLRLLLRHVDERSIVRDDVRRRRRGLRDVGSARAKTVEARFVRSVAAALLVDPLRGGRRRLERGVARGSSGSMIRAGASPFMTRMPVRVR